MAAAETDLHTLVDDTANYDFVGVQPGPSKPLSDSEIAYFQALLYERIRRDKEALRLYKPLDFQEGFHCSHAPERSLRAANRTGKTLSAAIEFARAVTGQDPHNKYPKAAGRAIIVCKNEKQCGEVVYKKLFKPGAFSVIRDEVTREWRPYIPEQDIHRRSERKKAPPLIPGRFYDSKGITWNKKNAEIPEKIVLKNGWEIYFFSSLGQAPQGWDVDCLSGRSEIYDPIAGVHRRIDQIDGPFHVWSYNKHTKAMEIRNASKPFVKGFGEIVRVGLSDGTSLFTTRRHLLLAEDGRWVPVQYAFDRSISLAARSSIESHEKQAVSALSSGPTHAWHSPFNVISIESLGQEYIWDITVPVTHNYAYANTISHNCAWFDEEIVHVSWYGEIAARLIDRAEWDSIRGVWVGGKFFWSATPQAGTLRLYEIHQRAVDAEGEEHPPVTEHTATMYDNPYLSDGAKAMFALKFENNSDEAAIRIYGEFALLGLRIFQEFMPRGVHGCKAFDIPANWTRYISVDPGRQVCAVLFAAVPPPSDARHKQVFFYDELYIRRCNAAMLAEKLAAKIGHDVIYEALIDHHAGRQTEVGSGKTVEEQYRQALKAKRVKFEKTGTPHFTWGSDDVEARILAVKSGLGIKDGSSRFVVFTDRCPHLVTEAEEYCNAKDNRTGLPIDKPLKLNDHQMDNWGYLAMHRLTYHSTKPKKERGGEAFQAIQKKKERAKAAKRGWGGGSVRVG